MTQYDKKKIVILLALLVIAAWLAYEYWSTAMINSETIMVRVKNLVITTDDFTDAARLAASNKYQSANTLKAKLEILDGLITEKLLVLEAQKKNFDKNAAFKKEIQSYWEQALIKRLLKEKLDDISFAVHVRNDEVEQEYLRMQKKVLVQTVVLYSKKAAEELSKAANNFEEAKAKLLDRIASDEPAEWRVVGDLPLYVENIVFSLKPGEVSQPLAHGNNWMVIKVLSEEPVVVGPIEKLAPDIKRDIFRRKKEQLFGKWVDTMRGGSDIVINMKKLKKIPLK